jgi:hypothetical protein
LGSLASNSPPDVKNRNLPRLLAREAGSLCARYVG